jgi:hypothetical protein
MLAMLAVLAELANQQVSARRRVGLQDGASGASLMSGDESKFGSSYVPLSVTDALSLARV